MKLSTDQSEDFLNKIVSVFPQLEKDIQEQEVRYPPEFEFRVKGEQFETIIADVLVKNNILPVTGYKTGTHGEVDLPCYHGINVSVKTGKVTFPTKRAKKYTYPYIEFSGPRCQKQDNVIEYLSEIYPKQCHFCMVRPNAKIGLYIISNNIFIPKDGEWINKYHYKSPKVSIEIKPNLSYQAWYVINWEYFKSQAKHYESL